MVVMAVAGAGVLALVVWVLWVEPPPTLPPLVARSAHDDLAAEAAEEHDDGDDAPGEDAPRAQAAGAHRDAAGGGDAEPATRHDAPTATRRDAPSGGGARPPDGAPRADST